MGDPAANPEHYVGNELELFQHAVNWKRYFASVVRAHLGGSVLEVGAGFGGTTAILCRDQVEPWVCLEPDAELTERLEKRVEDGELPACCRAVNGTLAQVGPDERFDTILYIDVLEHIEDDRGELRAAAGHLTDEGRIIVVSPAYQWLFSPFDRAIGHFRRYSRRTLHAATPGELRCTKVRYLDSVGVMASAANRFFMKQGMPTPEQIQMWDRMMVPLSRILDRVTFFTFGKSILGVWRRA